MSERDREDAEAAAQFAAHVSLYHERVRKYMEREIERQKQCVGERISPMPSYASSVNLDGMMVIVKMTMDRHMNGRMSENPMYTIL